MCRFVAHIYRCIPVNPRGTAAPITQYRMKDEINDRLASYIGVEHDQQVTAKWIYHKPIGN